MQKIVISLQGGQLKFVDKRLRKDTRAMKRHAKKTGKK